MAVNYIGFNSASGTTGSMACSIPSGTPVAGDIILAWVVVYGTAQPVISNPDVSWNTIGSDIQSATYCTARLAWKVFQTGDTSYTFTSTNQSRFVVEVTAYRGCSTTTPINQSNTGQGTTGTTVTVTTVTTNLPCMLVGLSGSYNTTTRTFASESFATAGAASEVVDTGNRASGSVAYKLQSSSGATGDFTSTINSSIAWWGGAIVALAPDVFISGSIQTVLTTELLEFNIKLPASVSDTNKISEELALLLGIILSTTDTVKSTEQFQVEIQSPPHEPTNYYVNTAADAGGDGTTTALTGAHCAFKTLSQVAAGTFSGDDNIYFNRGDTWNESLTFTASGTSGHPITLSAYGTGNKPIISGGSVRNYPIDCRGSYTVWDNLHITAAANTNFASADVATTNVTIQNCQIDYSAQSGIYIGLPNGSINTWTIQDNDISNNGSSATLHHGIYLEHSGSNIIQRNTFNNNASYGVQIQDASDDNIVRYNSFSDNGSGTGGGAVVIWNNGGGFPTGNQIYYNISNGDVTGVTIGGSTTTVTNNIYNNTFYGYTKYGLRIYNSPTIGNVKNNIFYSTVAGVYHYDDETGSAVMVSDYNCISPEAANYIWWNSSSYTTLAAFKIGSGLDTNSISSNPLFVNAGSGDFHLQNTSLCINAGTDVSLTEDYEGIPVPYGTNPDIGAYENNNLTILISEIIKAIEDNTIYIVPQPTLDIAVTDIDKATEIVDISVAIQSTLSISAVEQSETIDDLQLSISSQSTITINVTDQIEATENISIESIADLAIIISEQITCSDQLKDLYERIGIIDIISIDLPGLVVDLDISCSDGINAIEEIQVDVATQTTLDIQSGELVKATEDVTISIAAQITLEIRTSEQILITEILTISNPVQTLDISISDAIRIIEGILVSVSSQITFEIQIADQIKAPEEIAISIASQELLNISVADQVNISEVQTLEITSTPAQTINVSDSAKASEEVAVAVASQPTLAISVSEIILTQDIPNILYPAAEPFEIQAADQVKISEEINIFRILTIQATDTIQASEAIGLLISSQPTLSINVTDQARISEDLYIEPIINPPVAINVFSTVKVTENITSDISAQPDLSISIIDNIAIIDSPESYIVFVHELSVSDSIAANDTIEVILPALSIVEIDITDAINISESINIFKAGLEHKQSIDIELGSRKVEINLTRNNQIDIELGIRGIIINLEE